MAEPKVERKGCRKAEQMVEPRVSHWAALKVDRWVDWKAFQRVGR